MGVRPQVCGCEHGQYIPVVFLFSPAAGYVGLSAKETNAVAGLINCMRNTRQSVGTSAVTMLIAPRRQYHQSVLAEYTGSGRFRNTLTALSLSLTRVGLSAHAAQQQSLGRLDALFQSQAAVPSYVDAFWLLSMCWAFMFVSSVRLKKNKPGKGGSVSVPQGLLAQYHACAKYIYST
jgi:hypothetical protein